MENHQSDSNIATMRGITAIRAAVRVLGRYFLNTGGSSDSFGIPTLPISVAIHFTSDITHRIDDCPMPVHPFFG